VAVDRGAKLRWKFLPSTLHNVTVVCALHPVKLTEVVRVR